MTAVIWKYDGQPEQRKLFENFTDAVRFQGKIVKNKKGLEYAKYKLNVKN